MDGALVAQRECLYCRRLTCANGREHILQDGFRGGVRLPLGEVCDDCNRAFSPMDGHLVRFVHDFLCFDHPDVSLSRNPLRGRHAVYWNDVDKCWVSVRIDEQLDIRVIDQWVESAHIGWMFAGDPQKGDPFGRIQRMSRELLHAATSNVSVVVIDDPPVERAVVRSSPGTFVARASTRPLAEDLRTLILSGKFSPQPREERSEVTTERPHVHARARIELGSIHRALAKLCLNVVSHTFGPDVARLAEFDETRAFALVGGPLDSSPVVDVGQFPAGILGSDLMCPRGYHVVRLETTEHGLVALVWLYQRFVALVRLAAEPLRCPPFAHVLFNYTAGTVRVFREPHLVPLRGDAESNELERHKVTDTRSAAPRQTTIPDNGTTPPDVVITLPDRVNALPDTGKPVPDTGGRLPDRGGGVPDVE